MNVDTGRLSVNVALALLALPAAFVRITWSVYWPLGSAVMSTRRDRHSRAGHLPAAADAGGKAAGQQQPVVRFRRRGHLRVLDSEAERLAGCAIVGALAGNDGECARRDRVLDGGGGGGDARVAGGVGQRHAEGDRAVVERREVDGVVADLLRGRCDRAAAGDRASPPPLLVMA